jgi:hypothetical protein
MQQLTVDIEHGGATVFDMHDMLIPELVVQGLLMHDRILSRACDGGGHDGAFQI